MRNPKNQKTSLEVIKRRERVRDFLLQGMFNQVKIAAALGVSQVTISSDIHAIFNQWRGDSIKETRRKRDLVVRQLDHAAYKAMVAFDRSCQVAEEMQTVYHPKPCEDCCGTGFKSGDEHSGEWCETCGGNCVVMVEVVTRRAKGQAGDSSFLRVFNECVREKARLWGLYPSMAGKVVNKKSLHLHQHNGQTLNLRNVKSEDILAAKMAVERVRLGMDGGNGDDRMSDER